MKKRSKSEINIEIQGSGDFRIDDGEIVEANGGKFTAKKKGNKLILSSLGSGNITISGNGSNINISGGGSIIINGRKITMDDLPEAKEDPNAVSSYELNAIIESISISGSGSFVIDGDDGRIVSETLILSVTGSGDILCSNFRKLPIIATVTGSGDITLDNVFGLMLLATVTGSGDINNRGGSRFNSAKTTVTGSGDIDNF